MDKDAYYFPHFSNARHDRKLKRARKELGVEGYGIYFMLLEILRDQENFRYPLEDLDLLADEFGTSEQKVRTVICNYNLFEVDDKQNFFSMRFVQYLQPYLDNKQRNKINGIKGNLIKYKYITKEAAESLADYEIMEINEHRKELLSLPVVGESGGEQPSDRKEKKRKEKKREEIKQNNIKTFSSDSDEYRLSVLLYEFMKLNNPNVKKADLQSWSKNIDLMIRVDKKNPKDIERVIAWCQKDSFWKSNILSTGKLRDKYDQLFVKMNATTKLEVNNSYEIHGFDLNEMARRHQEEARAKGQSARDGNGNEKEVF